jgi:copper chaperone CopZ
LIVAEVILSIDGMSCQHCVMHVKEAVDATEGVQSAEVTIGKANVVYDDSKVNREAIALAIQNAGYKVVD